MFGLNDIGKGSVEEAHQAVNDVLLRLDPMITKIYMGVNALLNNAIDRFEINITIRVKPNPGSNPAPD